jgi:hypothetical protein
MALPAEPDVATRGKVPANDPRVAVALAVALSWARTHLARAADDDLSDLNDTGNEAVLGYAVDVLKLPALQLALTDPTNESLVSVPYEIGARWATMLGRGNKQTWAIR